MAYNHTIEDWWRHLGCDDRQQVSGKAYNGQDDYLEETDLWWNSLAPFEKENAYNEFFDEN